MIPQVEQSSLAPNVETTLAAAERYSARGERCIPIRGGEKRPTDTGWQERDYSDLERHFSNDCNIGVQNGAVSGNLVDIDVDDGGAAKVAHLLLPTTGAIYGRESRPRTHFNYRGVGTLPKYQKFIDPLEADDKRNTLVEFRSNGQSVRPPSLHPSGERYEWNVDGDPSEVDGGGLLRHTVAVAITALLMRHLPESGLHSISLSLAGTLVPIVGAERTKRIVTAIVHGRGWTSDSAWLRDWITSVETTAERIEKRETVEGRGTLCLAIGEPLVNRICEWLELGREKAAPHKRFTILSIGEFLKRPAPSFQVEGVLVGGSLAAIVGAPGSCKTFVALDLALSVASGTPWYGHEVMQAPVLYVSAEGSAGIGKRIVAWCQHREVPTPQAFDVLADAPQCKEQTDVDALLEAIAARPAQPGLIIVDTVSRTLTGADENSQKDVSQYVAGIDALRKATGATVVLVHHVNKGGSIRGSTVLPGALDTQINLATDEATNQVEVTCGKAKDCAEFAGFFLVKREVAIDTEAGPLDTSLVLDIGNAPARVEGLSSAAMLMLTTLREDFGSEGAKIGDWTKALAAPKRGGDGGRNAYRLRDRLVKDGYVIRGAEGLHTVSDRCHDSVMAHEAASVCHATTPVRGGMTVQRDSTSNSSNKEKEMWPARRQEDWDGMTNF